MSQDLATETRLLGWLVACSTGALPVSMVDHRPSVNRLAPFRLALSRVSLSRVSWCRVAWCRVAWWRVGEIRSHGMEWM